MVQIVSHEYGVEGVGISMQGGRSENQDDFGCVETPLGFLVVVCDGMGGGPGGKTASYLVKTTVMDTLVQCTEFASPVEMIKKAVDAANEALDAKMVQMPELLGMGSTLVMLLINADSAFVAHLGDSRCYQIRGEKIIFRTDDHSLVGELVRNKALTEEQARTSSQSNIITRGLGSTSIHVADISELSYKHGDRFVLCTDGVWGIMPHEDLKLRLVDKQEISSLVRNLSAEIEQIGIAQGGQYDNHTMVVVELARDSQSFNKMNKTGKILLGGSSLMLLVSVIFNVVSFLHVGLKPQIEALSHLNDSLVEENKNLATNIAVLSAQISSLSQEKRLLERTLSSNKDSNKEVNRQLIGIIDSMRVRIDTLEKTVVRLKEEKANAEKTNQEKTVKNTDILAECKKILQALSSMQEPSSQEAAKKVKANVSKCVELLEEFDKQTKNKHKSVLAPIIKKLRTSDLFKENKNVVGARGRNGQVFEVKKETKEAIKEMVANLNNLK